LIFRSISQGGLNRCTRWSVPVLVLALASATPQQEEEKEALAASARNFKFQTFFYPQSAETRNQFTTPVSINDAGVVVGNIHRTGKGCPDQDCGLEGFIYENGKFTLLNGPQYKGRFTNPVAINNRGQILVVQDPHIGGVPPQFFIYDMAHRTYQPVGPFVQIPGAPNKIRLAQITGFNDKGQFVGNYRFRNKQHGGYGTLPVGEAGSTTVPAETGNFTPIECPQGRSTNATSVNNRGQVTGACDGSPRPPVRSGFLFSNGTMTLFDFPDATLTRGNAINDAGAIAGEYTLKPRHPGQWPPTGFAYDGSQFTPVALHSAGPNGLLSVANGINNKGQITGMEGNANQNNGFVATPTGANPLHLPAGGR